MSPLGLYYFMTLPPLLLLENSVLPQPLLFKLEPVEDTRLELFKDCGSFLSWSAPGSHKKTPWAGRLKEEFIFHSFGGQKSKIKVWPVWFLVRAVFLAC